MQELSLKNISFGYDDDLILDNLSFTVRKGHNISIVGSTASGKSTLSKVLGNKLKFFGKYNINGTEVSKSKNDFVNQYISIVDNNINRNKKVIDLLFDQINDCNELEIKKIINYFKIGDYLDNKLENLSIDMAFYIIIISNLLKKDTYLVLDNILCYLNNSQKQLVYKYSKRNKVTIINISSDLEDVLYSEYLICLYNGKIAMEGNVVSCLKEEKLLKRLGFKLPFIYDLSLQLNYYEVIDDIYLDYKSLEEAIWK